MRKFKMQISTQTDNQKQRKNVATNENCILRKIGLKFQNPSFNPMQNSILEQAKEIFTVFLNKFLKHVFNMILKLNNDP